jgi:hypothetical protein
LFTAAGADQHVFVSHLAQAIPGFVYDEDLDFYQLADGCTAQADMPDLDIILGGAAFSVPASQWIQRVGMGLDTLPPTECVL